MSFVRRVPAAALLPLLVALSFPGCATQSAALVPRSTRLVDWLPANKEAFGTARTSASKVWFTVQGGRLSEVFHPRLDEPALRALELEVTDASGGWERLSEGDRGPMEQIDPLVFRQAVTTRSGGARVTQTFLADPERSSVLVRVQLEPLDRRTHRMRAILDLGSAEGGASVALGSQPPLDAINAPRLLTFALGFGPDAGSAGAAASASLDRGFEAIHADYVEGWRRWLATLAPTPRAAEGFADLYRSSLLVLAAHEDKTFGGAFIASPSMPWMFGTSSWRPWGPYHLVWSRDLYQIATALLAAGDRAAADRALDFLLWRQQLPSGDFPQNSRVDGTPFWKATQMDQVALPIVLAWQLGRRDARTYEAVRRAAEFIVQRGPRTDQERWETKAGYSPAALAAQIAGLVCASELARANGDAAAAERYLSTADAWAARVDRWTVTSNGPLGREPYYLRLAPSGHPDEGETYDLPDGGPDHTDQRTVLDPSFLELVRLGVRPFDHPPVLATLALVDRHLGFDAPHGRFWHRFNFDGYGEMADGSPWVMSTAEQRYVTWGRGWPLLSGERGEYALLAGDVAGARSALAAMARTATSSGMLPEQVWDERAPSGPSHPVGAATTSATPLAWTHAQWLRLALSLERGRIVEEIAPVACRYAKRCEPRD